MNEAFTYKSWLLISDFLFLIETALLASEVYIKVILCKLLI